MLITCYWLLYLILICNIWRVFQKLLKKLLKLMLLVSLLLLEVF